MIKDDQILLQDIYLHLCELNNLYAMLSPLVQDELKALNSHDISNLDAITHEKTMITDHIIEQTNCLHHALLKLCYRAEKESADLSKHSFEKISDIIPLFSIFKEENLFELSGKNAALSFNITSAVLKLVDKVYCIKPSLDQASNGVKFLVESYEQSHKFWSEIFGESAAVYTAKGQKTHSENKTKFATSV